MKIICIRKNICSHGKKNLLFLPSNIAAVQNLYTDRQTSIDCISIDYGQTLDRYIERLSSSYRPIHRSTIDQLSVKYRWTESDTGRHTFGRIYRPTTHRLQNQLPVHSLSTDYCRVSNAVSTNIAVDILVDITYSKHDPMDYRRQKSQSAILYIIYSKYSSLPAKLNLAFIQGKVFRTSL